MEFPQSALLTGMNYSPAVLNQTLPLVNGLAIKQNSLRGTPSFTSSSCLAIYHSVLLLAVRSRYCTDQRHLRLRLHLWLLCVQSRAQTDGTAERSVGTRDTSRQDKACCLCLFPLQCFWTMTAPALVLCLKPI